MTVTVCLVAFGIAFVLAATLTPQVRRLAIRWDVVDRPDNYRKVHERVIPRLGGVAIFGAFFIPLLFAVFLPHAGLFPGGGSERWNVLVLLAGGLVALGLGAADDVLTLPAKSKLLLQIVAALVAMFGGFRVQAISNPFGASLELHAWSYPVTLGWFLICMNAINLLDGLDGLAAGATLFASVTLFLVNASARYVDPGCVFTLACFSGAILGFLLYNFHPARIFLGDSGSMFLGFTIAALSVMQSHKAETAVTLLVPLVALGVPMFDTILAILRRWSRRLPLSAADRQHVHHVLISLGLSHRRAVLVLYGACVLLGAAAYLISVGRNEITLVLLGSLTIVAFVSVRTFGGVRVSDLLTRMSENLTRMGRAARAKVAVERAVVRMRGCKDPQALWGEFSEALHGLDLDFARLKVRAVNGHPSPVFTWPPRQADLAEAGDLAVDMWTARLTIQGGGPVLGELELGKTVGVKTLLAEAPELAERLRHELANHLARLYPRVAGLAQAAPSPSPVVPPHLSRA